MSARATMGDAIKAVAQKAIDLETEDWGQGASVPALLALTAASDAATGFAATGTMAALVGLMKLCSRTNAEQADAFISLIRQAKWLAAKQVVERTLEDLDREAIELERIKKCIKKQCKDKQPKSTDDETANPSPVHQWLLSTGTDDVAASALTEADVAQIAQGNELMGKPNLDDELAWVSVLATESVLQDIWYAEYMPATQKAEGAEPIHRFDESSAVGIADFLTRFRDSQLGWAPTFRVVLKGLLDDPKNAVADNQYKRALLADTNRLVRRLEPCIKALSERTELLSQELQRIISIVCPDLPLTTFVHVETQAEPFLKLIYYQRKTEMIGREDEYQELCEFLKAARPFVWWQIAGSGGQGKSRLALHLVDRHVSGWHAGFLRRDDLINIDWNTITFKRDTLCVVDYVADPQKADNLRTAIFKLNERQEQFDVRVRLLVLDREPYRITEDNERRTTASWFEQITGKASDRAAIQGSAWRDRALVLEDLSVDRMVQIAASFYEHTNGNELPDEQRARLTKSIEGTRACRPLLAMVLAQILGEGEEAGASLQDLLSAILKEERETYWSSSDNAPPEAASLALLANMVGVLKADSPVVGSLIGDDIPDSLEKDTWMVLGRSLVGGTQEFLAREPDLLAEWQVLEAFRHAAGSGFKAQPTREKLSRIANAAWKINRSEYAAFLSRVLMDFPQDDVCKLLTSHKPDCTDVDVSQNELVDAAIKGVRGIAESVLEANVDANEPDEHGRLALIATAANDCYSIAELLLECGADVDREKEGLFPLLVAAAADSAKVAEVLLENGAKVDRENKDGFFPLLVAAAADSTKVAQVLLQSGADVHRERKQSGFFPLLMAAQNDSAKVAKLLLEHEAEVDQKDDDGFFPLLIAAQNDSAKVAEVLLENGAKVDRENKDGFFPLLIAAQNDSAKVAKLLLEHGADPNQRHRTTCLSPLLFSVLARKASMLTLLLEYGADPLLLDQIEREAVVETLTGLAEQEIANTLESQEDVDSPLMLRIAKFLERMQSSN